MVITITTVGYGDYTPNSTPGRLLIMISAVTGALLVSMLVLVLTNMFALS